MSKSRVRVPLSAPADSILKEPVFQALFLLYSLLEDSLLYSLLEDS